MFEWDFDYIRLLAAFMVGVMITHSGTLIQGVTKNELASPSTLGFQAMIVFMILLLNQFVGIYHLEYISLGFGLLAAIIFFIFYADEKKITVYKNKTQHSMEHFLLIGLGLNLLVGAIFSIWHFIFMALNLEFPNQIWFGHFKYVDQNALVVVSIFFIILSLFLIRLIKNLQLLSLGPSFYTALGGNLRDLQKKVILLVFLQTLLVVSFFGVFSFSALIIPLVLRRFHFFAKSLFNEIIFGGVIGGLFFLIFDMICYQVTIMGAELPLGMLTSTIGSLVMITLLIQQKRKSL